VLNPYTVKELCNLPANRLYDLTLDPKAKIAANTPRPKADRNFSPGAQAYKFTNENLDSIVDGLKKAEIDLSGKTVFSIACSGDPLILFSALGADYNIAFDSSYKAVAWTEFKCAMVRTLTHHDALASLGQVNLLRSSKYYLKLNKPNLGIDAKSQGFKTQSGMPYMSIEKNSTVADAIIRQMSKWAGSIFEELFRNYTFDNIPQGAPPHSLRQDYISCIIPEDGTSQSSDFFRGGSHGYTGAFPELNGYLKDRRLYESASRNLEMEETAFIPGDIFKMIEMLLGVKQYRIFSKDFFKRDKRKATRFLEQSLDAEQKADLFYLSNVPDHLKDSKGNKKYHSKVFGPFADMVCGLLNPGGALIINHEWNAEKEFRDNPDPDSSLGEYLKQEHGLEKTICRDGSGYGCEVIYTKRR